MKMKILHSSILHIGIIPLLVFIFSSSAADDSSSPSNTSNSLYDTCTPRNCKNGPNITFPFYLDDDDEDHNHSCGYPGFDITCQGDYPMYCSSEAAYIVQNISDDGSSIQLINNSTKNSTCPVPLVNFSFERSGMNFTSDVGDLCFFYGCDISLFTLNATRISCIDHSFVSVAEVGHCDALFEQTGRDCDSYVGSPFRVNRSRLEDLKRSEGEIDYEELLRDGFTLLTGHDCSRCHNSGGRCGYDSTKTTTVCHCRDGTRLIDCNGNGNKQMKIGLGAGIGGLAVIVLVFSIYMTHHRRRRSKSTLSNNTSADDSFGGSNIYFEVPIFSNDELEKATNNFDSSKELGDGGYGTVYYGKLRDGREVAVKRLYEHNYRRVKQFMTEVQILTRLRHTNLVSLYGCTSRHSRELLLVYEYVPNGTVADHLHGDRTKPSSVPWLVRMNIAVETAKALAYLHKEGIIHRDVKTNNILLDKNFSVKVGDFGLSRLWPSDVTHVSTAPQGTPGYVDPEYHLCYQLTEKSDVYSFGVVLMELVSSMPAVDISRERHEINLANLAVKKIQKREVDELIDPNLNCESDEKVKNMVTAVIELAFRCLQQDREIRPTMEEVVEELENAVKSGRRVEEEELSNPIAKSTMFFTSPESDEAGLLTSPISVIVKNWTSSSSSINNKSASSTR